MKHIIQETKAFKSFEITAQKIVNRHASQVQIEDAIIQARNIGINNWKAQTGLPKKWQSIVEEIVTNEKT